MEINSPQRFAAPVVERTERADGMLAVVTKESRCCAPYRTYLEWLGMGPRPVSLPPVESWSPAEAAQAHADFVAQLDAELAGITTA